LLAVRRAVKISDGVIIIRRHYLHYQHIAFVVYLHGSARIGAFCEAYQQ